ncbi:MAG: amidohydrolase family protein [Deltaproteobacteria bacterium]|nr:amidohydrolase family protein [Deltaproteobacteria bacterium]
MQKIPDNIIDFHVHLFPDRLFDAVWEYFSSVYKLDIIHRLYYRQCVDYLRQRGVSPIVYSNYAHREGIAPGLNAWNLRILDEIDDLYCFAAFHPGDEHALDMARKVLKHPKVLGFKLQLLVQNIYPDDERLFPLYELVIENSKRILFHVGTGPIGTKYVGVHNFKRLLKRYSDLPANIAHMGGFEYWDFFDLLKEHDNIYFDTAWSFLPSASLVCDLTPDFLERHKNRILYGSDFPNLIYPREEEIDYLKDLDLSAEFYTRVFRENGTDLIQSHMDKQL